MGVWVGGGFVVGLGVWVGGGCVGGVGVVGVGVWVGGGCVGGVMGGVVRTVTRGCDAVLPCKRKSTLRASWCARVESAGGGAR